jgi:TolB-like protein
MAASAPPRLSIVVLPFANFGGNPEHEYFVDGVTESLTTDLSRMNGTLVIARNTAFTYKGKPNDVKQIGRELNVRYVLEGSVQRGGNRMRVNVQLIDAVSGAHLWAERFDKPLADLFDMQDEIVARLARQLDAELAAAEARRAERAPDPDAMDLYFQGTACWHKGQSPEILSQARGYFERALARDPGNVEALVGAAWTDVMGAIWVFMGDDRAQRLAATETAAIKILSLAPNHAFAHFVLGYVQIFTNRVTQGIAAAERALALDRNLANAHALIGAGKTFAGRAEESEAHIQEALRLSPHDSEAKVWMATLAATKLNLGAYTEAAQWARRSIEANRNFPLAHFWLAAALAQLGLLDEARQAIQPGLALAPGFTIARYRAGAQTDHPTYLAQRERIIEGMRKAGLPEG